MVKLVWLAVQCSAALDVLKDMLHFLWQGIRSWPQSCILTTVMACTASFTSTSLPQESSDNSLYYCNRGCHATDRSWTCVYLYVQHPTTQSLLEHWSLARAVCFTGCQSVPELPFSCMVHALCNLIDTPGAGLDHLEMWTGLTWKCPCWTMRSASSSTKKVRPDMSVRCACPSCISSHSRPGVATTICRKQSETDLTALHSSS